MEKTYYSSVKHNTGEQTPRVANIYSYVKKLLVLVTVLTVGGAKAWGQQPIADGLYYIANYQSTERPNLTNYNPVDLTKNFYLCPTEGYVYYKSPKYFQTEDTGMPFLTTYKVRDDNSYDINKALWHIKKHGDYYTIMHAATNKYITFNLQINGSTKANRMRFHLQASDSPEANDSMLFNINFVKENPTRYYLIPKKLQGQSVNPAKGNRQNLTGDGGEGTEGAPSGVSIYGIVGYYDAKEAEGGSQWCFEQGVQTPVIQVNNDGTVSITSPDGCSIHYTTDGTDPTASSSTYSGDITVTDAMTAIKAIAVRTLGNNSYASDASTLPIVNYTYNIVNKTGNVAIKKSVRQAVGTPLNGYSSIPADIRSPYISDETIKFSASTSFTDEDLIDKTPASATGAADIYISYSLDKLQNKFLKLAGARSLNVTVNGEYISYANSAFGHESSPTDAEKDSKEYLWRFYGEDPYAVTILNAASDNYMQYTVPGSGVTSSNLSMGSVDTAGKFIIMDGSPQGVGVANGQMELMAATGDGKRYRLGDDFTISTTSGHAASLQVRAYPNSSAKTYKLIDRLGKIIATVENKSDILALPDTLQSPLASYQFWNLDAFVDSILTETGTYKLWDGEHPAPTPLSNVSDATGDIYVTYTVKNDIDLTGNKTYMLKFLDGEEFYQEDGHDAPYTTKSKAYYPYNNGDFNLFVNGMNQWEDQLASGASTRTRWLWYFVSNKNGTDLKGDSIDPYHIIVKSNQNQSIKVSENGADKTYNGNSYLRTYKPNDDVGIITGVVAKHVDDYTHNSTYNYQTPSEAPTEYMLLGTSLNSMKLRTLDGHHVVNRFEQYWKNNPVANNILDAGGLKVTAREESVSLTAAQRSLLETANESLHKGAWHSYDAWAYSAPWNKRNDGSTNKKFEYKEHWFQTIDMGSGTFIPEETELSAMLILLDQHGWEIVRLPMPSNHNDNAHYEAIRKYSSPMVGTYHYWKEKVGSKVTGYHKYNVDDPITIKEVSGGEDASAYTTSTLGAPGTLPIVVDSKGKVRDVYVTYDVKPEYANAYAGAARADETSASLYLVKQGDSYAKINGTSLATADAPADMEHVPDEMQWYLKPNFNIDAEMGYKYAGEDGAQFGAKSKDETEADYVAAGKNGFDPYNMQIQSAKPNTARYFTANTDAPKLSSGVWTGTTSAVTLENLNTKKTATGHDQTSLKITNATFMVVDNGDGKMLLMPRFDNSKVMTSFTSLSAPLAANHADAGTQILTLELVPKVVHNSNEIKSQGGYFVLAEDFTVSTSIGTAAAPFKGVIDGKLNTFSGSSNPLVAYSDGAVIKNVILDNVSISSGATVKVGNDNRTATGALVCVATGATRIYNCGILASGSTVTTDADGYTHISSSSSSVSTGDYVGGLVGFLDGESRVINCFSYADITGGTNVGGIVGYNNVAGSASNNLKTMVMNCMFYGDITGGTNKAPIYNGNIISNRDANGVSNFNYFRADASYVQPEGVTYNCALMAEIRFLQRFEFFRHLLNSHRELAAWWALGDYNAEDQMMKWVLEPSQIGTSMPYPTLRVPGKYPSVVNIDAENAESFSANADEKQQQRNQGRKFGTLTVNIQMGSGGKVYGPATDAAITTPSLTLNITDKDPDHFNFNYYKVQLPYYNDVGTKNYNGNRMVTGWKIVNITGGTTGSYTTGTDATATVETNGEITLATPYNFADRHCTNKDLYSVSGRVFNQGAYWDVPEGVTAITIEPYWAKCVYLSDQNADKVYNSTMTNGYDVPNVGGGKIYTNGNSYPIAGENQVVYTSMGNAIASSGSALFSGVDANKHTVYDYAVVLVGNYHHYNSMEASNSKPYTVTSIDLDGDNEPDYSYILRFDSRTPIHPVRVDFINIPGFGMAQKSTGGTGSYNFGILQPKNWFESTNTSLFRVTQFEYDAGRDFNLPYILQGGVFEQWVGGQTTSHKNKITYFHVGGNVWFKEFHRGTHQDKQWQSKHPPVSVTGGDFDEFYLTGLYRADVANGEDNAECYINGGRFGIVAGAAMEGIGKKNGANNTGNITWQIQNADIDEFYGGGINAAKPVEGNITNVVEGGYIKLFCGGPKFGDMNTGKKVTTKATDCIFGTYYGAGYGGNSYSRQAPYNHNNVINFPHSTSQAGNHASWNAWVNAFYKQDYNATYGGVSTQFNYQFLPMSGNADNCARLFVEYVKFSLATTREVTSTLTGCTVTGNFYGGGKLGKVDGNVTSTLTDCTVRGNVFGAGYSGALPTVEVDSIGFRTEPWYYESLGTYRTGVKGATTTYTWAHGNAISIDKTNHILYTTEDLTTLGTVTGTVTLNIDGSTTNVGADLSVDGEDVEMVEGGNVYGGGESSDATGDVVVNIVGGSMTDVYGGGKGQTTVVSGNVKVNIGAKTGEGNGPAIGNVYGGSALGAVNATKDATGALAYTDGKKDSVNIYRGTISGSVYGGGLGSVEEDDSIAAQNFGPVMVTMEGGTVGTAVYGGSNANGVLKQTSTVTIKGGTVGTAPAPEKADSIANVVFGGGFGEPTRVEGLVTVNIGAAGQTTGGATYHGSIYGGGALGSVNDSIEVNLLKGTIIGNVFGGGLGRKAKGDTTAVAAIVTGDVTVTLDGAKLVCNYMGEGEDRMPLTGQIFGCNNLNGTPQGHVLVHVKRTVDSAKPVKTARDDRNTYDVAAVYGGGNQADYIPTKALGTDAEKAQAFAEVIIEGCDTTSIEYVYGGGNAAAVPATDVTIMGSYIIDYVFGGGNGKSTATFTNPGANIGQYDNGATEYGTGKAVTKLIGGKIHYVFGGSNTLGNVRGGTSVTMPQYDGDGDACDSLDVREIYGAGKNAEQDGPVMMVLGCVKDMDVVYGGAQDANVKGGIDLTITSGTFSKVFGGNNISGTIQGPITLTIEETACEPVNIGEVFLGGNQAAYSVYGYKQDGEALVARTGMDDGEAVDPPADDADDDDITEHQLYRNPVLNVVSCTSIGDVFGGGFGSGAKMYGSPTVNINMVPGKYADKIDRDNDGSADNDKNALGTIGNVYGGGSEADVFGHTTVNICTEPTVAVRTSMGSLLIKPDTVAVKGALITGSVFGAGKGLETVVDSTTIVMAGGSVAKSVYGGGELGSVNGNTRITVSGGAIGNENIPQGGAVYGNVYGGGQGNTEDVKAGLIKGNTYITISDSAKIYHNIYGGGAFGSVGDFEYNDNDSITSLKTAGTGVSNITITGGTIGIDGHENGMVFGSSRGEVAAPGFIDDRLAWVYDANVVIGTAGSDEGPHIHGSLYGSGENGHTVHNTSVTIHSGLIGDTITMATDPAGQGGAKYPYRGNVYGGGCGTDKYDNNTKYNLLSGVVLGNTSVVIDGGRVVRNVYGAGSMGSVIDTTHVTIGGSAVIGAQGSGGGYVYAAARGDEALSDAQQTHVGATVLTVSGGTVWGDAFGGGQAGIVKGAVAVSLTGGTLKQDVYGGGALANTNTDYDANDNTKKTYVTTVTLAGATVAGDLYGGGLGRLYKAGTAGQDAVEPQGEEGQEGYVPGSPAVPAQAEEKAVEADAKGPVTVTVSDGQATRVFGCNNLNGSPKDTVAVVISGTATITGASAISNVYGGGNQAAYSGTRGISVAMSGGTVDNVYGGGLGASAVVHNNTNVDISGGTVGNDVFGGGSQADVEHSVNVSVRGGTITHNVYGGGALANTNTANWDASREPDVTWEKITGTLRAGETVVTGLYKKVSENNYELVSTPGAKAEGNAEYYRKFETAWATGKTSASDTTRVTLTGGKIGNAFGGGLGNDETAVYVYGDVKVIVDGSAFTSEKESNVVVAGENYPSLLLTGSVFGSNNFNGSPKGNVTVEVFSTKRADGSATHVMGDYEIQAVYGGGNLADYQPALDKQTKVIVYGCDATSIEKVYGGGNSASVPSTDVTIYGAFDIGYAFGGGNGSKPVQNSAGVWHVNEGAMVTGNSRISAKGGHIGQVFGGSDAKGDILGSPHIDTSSGGGECPLVLTRIFGAGNEADVAGDVNIILSGCSSDSVQYVHGGSYNAHISGNVNLTITSGVYTNVFGGNDARGSIGGSITVNIEETDECEKPIIIRNLVGGGNEAAYPGIKRNGTEYETPGNITVNVKSATRIDNVFGGGFKSDVKGNTTVNINMTKGSKANHPFGLPDGYSGDPIPNLVNGVINDSIGTIGNVYGGGKEGNVIGHATVNINSADTVPILRRKGGVYGAAFIDYKGDSVYNYKGELMYDTLKNTQGLDSLVARKVSYANQRVLGAHITGHVFGGGNLAVVGKYNEAKDSVEYVGNTYVNICAKAVKVGNDTVWQTVAPGAEGVYIRKDVYGGGEGKATSFKCLTAMVTGSTNVRIGNGTVGGSIYGGGQVGRVEQNTSVTIGLPTGTSTPEVGGNVFAAGRGVNTHGYSALVRGNSTAVIQRHAKVGQSIYGGGEMSSVGRYTVVDGMPVSPKDNGSGYCTVIVRDSAEVGPNGMTMKKAGGPDFSGNVFGAGKGVLPYEGYEDNENPKQVLPTGTVYFKTKAQVGEGVDSAYYKFIESLALATQTYVTIGGRAFIKGSVYGGSENGYVQHDTRVTIQDNCQIGCGKNTTERYADVVWGANYTPTTDLECASWDYDKNSGAPYDKYAIYESGGKYYYDAAYTKYAEGGAPTAKDGHTYFGNVFGGGSGVAPYAPGKWHREAGSVGGNTRVEITGGHILTSVYGGNEQTDVAGNDTILMSGGTLGVPRTDSLMKAHPVTCYLFGAGKGDQRIFFNTWTNVKSAYVEVSGTSRIYGSVFGGGEDGHVLENVKVVIKDDGVRIGTTGTSYVDGNVFGGGRGFSGEALTAGSVGGNVDVDISGGTMLGSIYGGGRLASVGTFFTNPDDPLYGQLQEDGTGEGAKTHGHITVNISGGTIGNTDLAANTPGIEHSGNVFGGCMGRLTLLDDVTINPIWPELAQSKTSTVSISGATRITRNVYGGGEFGSVRENAAVSISAGTIDGNVFGGGKGSDDHQHPTTIEVHWDNNTAYYTYTPMQWAGCVGGNTTLKITGGAVKKNVYGGGELASVGIIDYSVVQDEAGEFTYNGKNYKHKGFVKHEDIRERAQITEKAYGFALSWPYEFTYVPCNPTGLIGGETTVTISGGRIGTGWDDGTGYVFGGGKGQVQFSGVTDMHEQRYTEAFCANVRKTTVNIEYASTPEGIPTKENSLPDAQFVLGAVYGGGEDGHVYEDAAVNITKGLIGLSVYGGGKGINTYKGYLRNQSSKEWETTTKDLYSWTAGKVYGNATVTMEDGHVINNVYGGGYLGSVGKGNYAGGTDDYYPAGYGETLDGEALWTKSDNFDPDSPISETNKPATMADHFLSSGNVTVTIKGGTVGTMNGLYGNMGGLTTHGTPTGMVFGGSRGQAAQDVGSLSPRYAYAPDFFLGYVNNATVTIGKKAEGNTASSGPTIYSQVFGGGRDGHVRGSTYVTIWDGTIGQPYEDAVGVDQVVTADYQRYHRGNVYGSGSGLGTWDGTHHGTSSGSVTRHTRVDIHGGTIYNNVYGGGAMSTIGPPTIPPTAAVADSTWSKCIVNIYGGKIGSGQEYEGVYASDYDKYGYGGCVYGASRGDRGGDLADLASGETIDKYATSLWTEVNIMGGTIAGNVYGGGQGSQVKKDTEVNLLGGVIGHDAYGGGRGIAAKHDGTGGLAANVGGNVTVTLNNNNNGGDAKDDVRGCVVDRIFGCNNLNGSPMGKVTVHVYATQNSSFETIAKKFPKRLTNRTNETPSAYLELLLDSIANGGSDYITPKMDAAVIERARLTLNNSTDSVKVNLATDSVLMQLHKLYDVRAVYGGGNLAPYEAENDSTHVIIDGCQLTSIYQVYGSGNAASTPACHTIVNGTYEIDELFGGGNGRDSYEIDGLWYENPGANVGYRNYTHVEGGSGTKDDPYKAKENSNATDKEFRQAYYRYGSGVARTDVYGGRIHNVYGGSNEKGNISEMALSVYEKASTCESIIDKTYGAGKNAEIDGEVQMVLDCVDYMAQLFGGSTKSDVNSDIYLRVTNGRFGQVYGGNDQSGRIFGSITVEVQEQGCKPITIGKLYGGGYLADYSIYGYDKKKGTLRTKKEFEDSLAIFNANMETFLSTIAVNKRDSVLKDTLIRAGLFGYPKDDPRVSIISATRIDSIFGGGYQATVIGSPRVNVNMEPGLVTAKYVEKNSANFSVGQHTVDEQTYRVDSLRANGNAILAIGTIGHIWGGGDLADVQGDTYVEIGTGRWIKEWDSSGNVVEESLNRKAAAITGNIYGGGKGEAKPSGEGAFECQAAMVGIENDGVAHPEGGTSVIIGNGSVGGNVYGGGEIARVEKNTVVTIGLPTGNGRPVVAGSVFGAGKGVETHGYSALVRGNTTVTIQGKAKVGQSVYGGGEMASVGRYNVADVGTPYSLANSGSGYCTVIVRDSAEIGPDNMVMYKANGEPDNTGHVFGAGKGVTPFLGYDAEHKPWRVTPQNAQEIYTDTLVYLKYVETLGLATQTSVTIGGHAFVKGDVFGGSEQGFVQHDTQVIIQDSCQIGNGYILLVNNGDTIANYGVNRRYTDEEWKQGKLIGDDNWTTESLPECAHWPYGVKVTEGGVTKTIYAQYDKYANQTGDLEKYPDGTSTGHGRHKGSDGHSFYGNVFGGGSGYFPYAPGKWHYASGSVGGNTLVEITGGHILTNVYGGNELTDVGREGVDTVGTCTVRMTGGTVGVPRTLAEIAAHPITCYVYGGGMGDPRTFFNKHTNVRNVNVEVSGGHIFGSVFGGAEDGHVLKNVKMDIKPGAWIGTWGTSYVDGNVFGGGRGFTGEALTAGNVGDSVVINISGGRMLGSIYGGGRLGSVGYDLKEVGEAGYGKMSTDPARGHVVVNISGGTIGNDNEYTYIAPNATEEQVAAAKVNMPNTLHDTDNRLLHTKGGNVFTGGMGRFYLLDDSTVISHWYDLGKVKSTKLTVSDSARIKSNIYGGGELGWVGGKHVADAAFANVDSLSTEILITGGTIGTEIAEIVGGDSIPRYTIGSVYGGGRGDTMEKLYKTENEAIVSDNPKFYAGRVVGSTRVEMQDGLVLGSVYGGGQVGNVGMASSYGEVADSTVATNVIVSGGTIGRDTLIVAGDTIRFGGATMGNVYGGGSGDRTIVRCGLVLGNSNVDISQAEGKTTRIYHNVYGGGAYGTVGDFNYVTDIDPNTQTIKVSQVKDLHTDSTGIAKVTITGGEIGIDGHNNGMIFGSSRGDVSGQFQRDDYMAWAYDTNVSIGNDGGGFGPTEPRVHGSIYGGGENGHVLHNTHVDINSGYVGDSVSYYAYRGNVYGAGCGTDTIMVNGVKRYKPLAGVVRGNTNVNISGGLITGGVYGAGAMAYVGTVKNDTTQTQYRHTNVENSFALSWPYEFEFVDTTGTATINITGGHIGINGTDGGDVYGSARGEAGDRYITAHHAYVKDAFINIDLPRTASPAALDSTGVSCITGSVHGSGEDGYVYGDAHVTLEKGLIGHSIYGAGKGKGTYKTRLLRIDKPKGSTLASDSVTTDIYSLISGRVMGNTYVTMKDGHVIRSIYGGGNMGSVGKGNYAGGPDDYFTNGYGEKSNGNLWDSVTVDSKTFLGSGKATVKVLAGTVGNPDKLTEFKEGLPLGNVFGGSRGLAAPNVPSTCSPRYLYCPTFFSGYVNETDVTIGTDSTDGPRILCSVFGGAQDGHVRRWTNVKVNSGTIGLPFTAEYKNRMKAQNINDSVWLYRGNVYGAGSGISEFKYDFDGDGEYNFTFDNTADGRTTTYTERGYSTSAGSVTHFTHVDIKGGTIYRNVVAGGSLASVGPLKLPTMAEYAAIKVDSVPANWGKQSLNEVIIGGGKTKAGKVMRPTIGERTGVNAGYGGNVFGGSRGEAEKGADFGTSVWTKVYIKDGADILGSVFGGGNAGEVLMDTDVQIGEPKESATEPTEPTNEP